ncbi:3-hydroxyacyl-CoA dehydrogenase family protein [Desulfoluna butyratoxydans]|uniref:3-hydroxyacyl-coa dehydrogenase nad binding n=1 Tax=Desulfoluna butyratoxydans TaxID=231438 RepID=A0A4U8YU44_9BACT|nr:3-hydroxyacyl-CoA dehydrogenase family protein [Desulfoluna butyratoxydans]VFQ44853.1 3-hydroxyacyl-coa dehydrogenase nad binding [Desulfoluna butyratoxydans]
MSKVTRVGIVGAGMMGAEIALCCAQSGMDVILKEVSQDLADRGKGTADKVLARRVEKGRMDGTEKENILSRIEATDMYDGFDEVDLVIEAILEVTKTKRALFEELDVLCKPECVFASNTSSISITKLAAAARPDRFVGLHFFSPASVMKLVEVIPGLLTSTATAEFAMAFCRAIGKEPVMVKNVEGFVVNRILLALMNEAYRLLDEGVATKEDIDTACRLGLGHPVGPFRLSDNISLDLLDKVHTILTDAYGDRFKTPGIFREHLDAGRVGRKAGKGWYDY